MLDFTKFKLAVSIQFSEMSKHDMYRSQVEKDVLWSTYLASFPAGSNPIFRKRTEHDCACCRQFIRAIGDVIAIINGKIVSLWDVTVDDPAYQAVADSMATLVKSKPIYNQFLHEEMHAGTEVNHERCGDGQVISWGHFHVNIPSRPNQGKRYYRPKAEIGPLLSDARARAHHDVLLRSLNQITPDAIATVQELIAQNSLYRGNEHRHAVDAFGKLKTEFDKLPADAVARDVFAWSKMGTVPSSVSKIRNTSIGTLLSDLSSGEDLEAAVRQFEAMVAPANYKRSTALVTANMVQEAREEIDQLGLTPALERRFARLADITVNDIIFADRQAKRQMNGDVFDTIATKPVARKDLSKIETMSIEKFLADVVPRTEMMEVLLENKHEAHLVSLVAPVDRTAKSLFKWDNGFSWSYNGDVTDSVKERVKKAGGNVSGDLCCRLAWHNFDDLDFHMSEPNRFEIYYLTRNKKSPCGGLLDVDMNAARGTTRTPVENIFYESRRTMHEGTYVLSVHNYSKRENVDVGFEVEIDWLGDVHRFIYDKPVRQSEKIVVATLNYSHQTGIEVRGNISYGEGTSKTLWALPTQQFHKVAVIMNSPNHWEGESGIGHKHYFFMLDGCINDGQARGFFNEFLRGDLDKHRKVLELVGNKMRTQQSPDQLSGIGFSDTTRNALVVRVSGSFTRTIKVTT